MWIHDSSHASTIQPRLALSPYTSVRSAHGVRNTKVGRDVAAVFQPTPRGPSNLRPCRTRSGREVMCLPAVPSSPSREYRHHQSSCFVWRKSWFVNSLSVVFPFVHRSALRPHRLCSSCSSLLRNGLPLLLGCGVSIVRKR